jgi:GSCFA family
LHFRTEIPAAAAPFRLSHQSKVMTIGSCFAENIGEMLLYNGFDTLINPFGIVYNPLTIAEHLRILTDDSFHFNTNHIFKYQGLQHSFWHHSAFDRATAADFLQYANQQLAQARNFLIKADTLLLTLGSAQIHEHADFPSLKAVANCHKLPQTAFETSYAEISDIAPDLRSALMGLQNEYPNLRIVFTLSPVRYWREGIINSNISKAILRLAIREIMDDNDYSGVYDTHYFPAYEYLLDDLRDYRFFADDMLHPSPQAIAYIWEKFAATFFDAPTLQHCERITKVRKKLAHRPFQADTIAHQAFLAQAQAEWNALKMEFPHL